MSSENVIEFTDDNFDAEVINSQVPVLVDFWAEWCMPCRMIAPVVEQIADEYEGRIKVGKLDTDASRETAGKFGIQAIPSLLLFKNGEVVKKIVGLKTKSELKTEIDALLASGVA